MLKLQLDPADSISRIISGSVLVGGALIFVEEGMTPGAKVLLEHLSNSMNPELSFSEISIQSLLVGENSNLDADPKNVLFLGDILQSQLESLARVYLGKVIKCTKADWSVSLFDAFWDCSRQSPDHVFSLIENSLKPSRYGQKLIMKPSAIVESVQAQKKNVVLFLDRDDVIVHNVPYNNDPKKVVLMPGIAQVINKAHQNKELVIICSNQSGIGRGTVTLAQYNAVHERILKLLKAENATIDDCFWASYIESSVLPDETLEPQMRKPRPGMFLLAARKWNADMRQSRMVGDSAGDLIAAFHAGIQDLYLLCSVKVEQEKILLAQFQKRFPEFKYQAVPDLMSL